MTEQKATYQDVIKMIGEAADNKHPIYVLMHKGDGVRAVAIDISHEALFMMISTALLHVPECVSRGIKGAYDCGYMEKMRHSIGAPQCGDHSKEEKI